MLARGCGHESDQQNVLTSHWYEQYQTGPAKHVPVLLWHSPQP
jgi:hypothetical protein